MTDKPTLELNPTEDRLDALQDQIHSLHAEIQDLMHRITPPHTPSPSALCTAIRNSITGGNRNMYGTPCAGTAPGVTF